MVIEIALGIVVGVILLVCLPWILAGILLAVIPVGVGVGIFIGTGDANTAGWAFAATVVVMLIFKGISDAEDEPVSTEELHGAGTFADDVQAMLDRYNASDDSGLTYEEIEAKYGAKKKPTRVAVGVVAALFFVSLFWLMASANAWSV